MAHVTTRCMDNMIFGTDCNVQHVCGVRCIFITIILCCIPCDSNCISSGIGATLWRYRVHRFGNRLSSIRRGKTQFYGQECSKGEYVVIAVRPRHFLNRTSPKNCQRIFSSFDFVSRRTPLNRYKNLTVATSVVSLAYRLPNNGRGFRLFELIHIYILYRTPPPTKRNVTRFYFSFYLNFFSFIVYHKK